MDTASLPFQPTADCPTWEGEPKIEPVRLGASILGLVALADWLFFGKPFGASLAVFGFCLLVALVLNRAPWRWNAVRVLGLVLILGALAQAAVGYNFFNVVVLGLLLGAAMVDQPAEAAGVLAAAWPLACFAALGALGRWQRFLERLCDSGVVRSLGLWTSGGTRTRAFAIVLPSLLVAVPFLLLFSSGNAILGSHLGAAFDAVEAWATNLHLPGAGRIFLWLFIGTAALVFLFPRISPWIASLCVREWPTFPIPSDRGVALARSVMILVVLNVLFFWANGVDALFLWWHAQLPAKVTYSAFVHEGIFSLTLTTLLSAVVLTAIFQQVARITRDPWLKGLAIACIAQNLFLISSVALRLVLYIEAYDLSVARVHVGTFLVAVVLAYLVIALRILGERSLNWMASCTALAVFGLFYLVQFVDVNGWVARYNVSCWLEHRGKPLDLCYLSQLGPTALPELARLEREAPGTPAAAAAANQLAAARAKRAERGSDWRGWQWREAAAENQVFSSADRPGRLSP
jgi:hypothetical protein